MFQSVLKSVVSSLSSSIKDTAKSYKPTEENIHGSFERIAQLGIGQLSFRSPILADIAEQVLINFQATTQKKSKLREYIQSDESKELRVEAKKNLPESATSRQIDIKMLDILEKLDEQVRTNSSAEADKNKFFQHYKKYLDASKTKQPTNAEPVNTSGISTGTGLGDSSAVLVAIEANTRRTYNAIEVMVSQRNVSGVSEGGQGGGGATYIDPMTGLPSMRAAVGSIGGSFLGKVFSEDVVSKYANKTRGFMGFGESTPTTTQGDVTPETIRENEKSSNIRSASLLTAVESILDEVIAIHKIMDTDYEGPEKKSSNFIEKFVNDKLQQGEDLLRKKVPGLPGGKSDIPEEPTKRPTKRQPQPRDPKTGKFTKKVADSIPEAVKSSSSKLGTLKGVGSKLLGVLNPITKVAAAGAAGYAVGSFLNESLGLSDKISDMAMDIFHPEVKESLKPVPLKNNISALSAAKEAKKATDSKAPVIINTQAAPQLPQQKSAPNLIVGNSNVRNKESTYERVQMQDFWSRSA